MMVHIIIVAVWRGEYNGEPVAIRKLKYSKEMSPTFTTQIMDAMSVFRYRFCYFFATMYLCKQLPQA